MPDVRQEALRLTRPAISTILRRLEQAVGAQIVKRTPQGVERTTEGVALKSHVRQLRISLADVARAISDRNAGRREQARRLAWSKTCCCLRAAHSCRKRPMWPWR